MRAAFIAFVCVLTGCATHPDPLVTVGMPFRTAEERLRAAGAKTVTLQTIGEDETHIFHDYALPDGAHLRVAVARSDDTISRLVLQRRPDPSLGKTLGPSEMVKDVDLKDHDSQQQGGGYSPPAARSAQPTP